MAGPKLDNSATAQSVFECAKVATISATGDGDAGVISTGASCL
jgi:hypothetical protein